MSALFAVLLMVCPVGAVHSHADRPRMVGGHCGTESAPAGAGRDRHEERRGEVGDHGVAPLDDAVATDVNAEIEQDDPDPRQSNGGRVDLLGGKRPVDPGQHENVGFADMRFAIQRK
jgi:hypothetical protein